MGRYSPMPDAEAVVISALRNESVCDGRVYSKIPASPSWPLATVQRLGGTPRERHRVDAPRIQVDVWADMANDGNDKADAHDEADSARLAIHELEGTTDSTLNAAVTAVDDELGLTWLPDSQTGRGRYTFTVVLTTHDFQG